MLVVVVNEVYLFSNLSPRPIHKRPCMLMWWCVSACNNENSSSSSNAHHTIKTYCILPHHIIPIPNLPTLVVTLHIKYMYLIILKTIVCPGEMSNDLPIIRQMLYDVDQDISLFNVTLVSL